MESEAQGAGGGDQTVTLRVSEALPKDVGRGIVRLDPQDLDQLGVGIGDVVEIAGKRATVARAMPAYAEQRGMSLIQVDGIPVVAGDRVRVDLIGTKAQTFSVTKASPEGPVLVGPRTSRARSRTRTSAACAGRSAGSGR